MSESAAPRPVPVSAPRAATSGAVSAAAALGVGELVVGLIGKDDPSLVAAVGAEFIDRFAASLKEIAVSLFGTNDKVALVVGIVVVSLAFGALVGVVARRRPVVGTCGFAAFAMLGIAAYLADEVASPTTGIVAATAAAAAGVASLRWLMTVARRIDADPVPAVDGHVLVIDGDVPVVDGVRTAEGIAPSPASSMNMTRIARRAFLETAAAVTAVAAGAAMFGRQLAAGGSSDAARATVELPPPSSSAPVGGSPLDVPGLSPYVTPNSDFYRIDTALTIPQVSLDSWRLKVTGMVDQSFEISHAELLQMESVETMATIACVSNEVGGHLVGNAVWQGVPLAALLDRARPKADATQIVGRSLDGWTAGFPAELIDGEREALVAYGMNGEPLPVRHGFPARLIVPGLYGYVSATKWLSTIELTTWDSFDGYWVPRGWSKRGPIKTQSRIDVPRSGAALPRGTVPIAGVAWAPTRGVTEVEVQIDDGPWLRCELGEAVSENTWVQWSYLWDATPGDHVLSVRATDGDGNTQTRDIAPPAPDGATGWHSRRVSIT